MVVVADESVWMCMRESFGAASRARKTTLASEFVEVAGLQTLSPKESCVSMLYQAAPIMGSARLLQLSARDPSV